MSEMVERVKAVLCKVMDDYTIPFDGFCDGMEEAATIAMIAAMREPTEAMTHAAYSACGCDEAYRIAKPSDHWRAMIDEALK
jgi:hypothetical protein